jgi:hypothetical protein
MQGHPEWKKLQSGWPIYLDELDRMFMGVAVDGSSSYVPGDEDPVDVTPNDEENDSEDDHGLLPLMGRVHMCLEMRILWTSPQMMKRMIQRTIMACRPRRAPKQEDTRQLAKPTQYCYEPRQEDEEPGSPSHGVSNAAAQRDTNPKECSHESGKGLWCH